MIFRSDPDWHNARIGKLTASNMWKAVDFTAKGQSTAARNKYMAEIVAERMTDIIVPHYVSPAMQWGIDHQAEAISEFEVDTGLIAGPEAFFSHPKLEFGATPDGLIGDHSLLEVKCPETAGHIRYCLSLEIPIEYQYQMAAQCACTNRHHGYFVSFDPRIKKTNRLLKLTFSPSMEFLDKVYAGAVRFLNEVDELSARVSI